MGSRSGQFSVMVILLGPGRECLMRGYNTMHITEI